MTGDPSTSLDEIQQQAKQQTTTAAHSAGGASSSSTSPTPPAEAESDSSLSLPGLSVSKRTLAILAVVAVVAYLAWRFANREDSSTVHAAAEMQRAVEDELPNEVEATPDDGETEDDRIVVPQSRDDPLSADEAVLNAFRDRGRIGGAS